MTFLFTRFFFIYLFQTNPFPERAQPDPAVRAMRSHYEELGHGHVSTAYWMLTLWPVFLCSRMWERSGSWNCWVFHWTLNASLLAIIAWSFVFKDRGTTKAVVRLHISNVWPAIDEPPPKYFRYVSEIAHKSSPNFQHPPDDQFDASHSRLK